MASRETYRSDAPPNTYGIQLQARTGATSIPIVLKAPSGPKVRCTAEEARATAERPPEKICSADLRPLVADVTGVARAYPQGRPAPGYYVDLGERRSGDAGCPARQAITGAFPRGTR